MRIRTFEGIDVTDTQTGKATLGLDEHIASLLCYLVVWITGIIFYLLENDNKVVRFHALQSILTFLPLNILYWIVVGIFWWSGIAYILGILIGLLMLVLWIVLMIKAYQGEKYKLPIVGEMAENATK